MIMSGRLASLFFRGGRNRRNAFASVASATAILILLLLVFPTKASGLSYSGRISTAPTRTYHAVDSFLFRYSYELQSGEVDQLDKAMTWTWWGAGSLGVGLLAPVVAFTIDPLTGFIIGAGSNILWIFASYYMALNYGALRLEIGSDQAQGPPPDFQYWSSLVAAISAAAYELSLGAYYSEGGGWGAIAGVCAVVSFTSGISAIVSSITYNNKVRLAVGTASD